VTVFSACVFCFIAVVVMAWVCYLFGYGDGRQDERHGLPPYSRLRRYRRRK
jgi:hypothetical protein